MKYRPVGKIDNRWLVREEQRVYEYRAEGKLGRKRKRKQLWRPYFEVVEGSKAKIFVMENVPQLLGSFEHGEIMGIAEGMGFKVWGDVLCAADYGVAQTRRRAFIIGCKFFDPKFVFPPRKTHLDPSKGGGWSICSVTLLN